MAPYDVLSYQLTINLLIDVEKVQNPPELTGNLQFFTKMPDLKIFRGQEVKSSPKVAK